LRRLRRNMQEEKILNFLVSKSNVVAAPAKGKKAGRADDRSTPSLEAK
jgi:hypothetical protein